MAASGWNRLAGDRQGLFPVVDLGLRRIRTWGGSLALVSDSLKQYSALSLGYSKPQGLIHKTLKRGRGHAFSCAGWAVWAASDPALFKLFPFSFSVKLWKSIEN